MPRVVRPAYSLLIAMLASRLLGGPAAAQTLEILHAFSGPDGCVPSGGLVVDHDTGVLYGTTKFCGASGNGAVFSLTPPSSGRGKWKFEKLHDFQGNGDGAHPVGLTFVGADSRLVGVTETGPGAPTCVNGCGTLFIMEKSRSGKKWRLARSIPLFADATARGLSVEIDLQPNSGAPVVEPDGLVAFGTALTRSLSGAGAVYEVGLHTGEVALIYDPDVDDAAVKTDLGALHNGGGLAVNSAGRLVGTAVSGGSSGAGTLFELNGGVSGVSSGTVLVAFPDNKPSPISPLVAPTFGTDLVGIDNIFGTTIAGGDNSACPNSPGCGTVWKFDTNGNLSVLHSFAFFTDNSDGQQPNSPLVIDPSTGLLYGTTLFGGTGFGDNTPECASEGCGTIFEVDASGTYQVLWQFDGGADPANPEGTLAFDSGALFGTSDDGGQGTCFTHTAGCGTVWKLTP